MIDIQALSTDLTLGEDGIWHGPATRHVSYPTEGNDTCFAVEDASFWFRHRNNCIISLVKKFPPENQGAIFDIGGGNGFVATGLEAAGFNVVLMEPGLAGASNARKRGLKNIICATTDSAHLKKESLPAVGLFDVVEHIEDDLGFLRSIRALLKQGGRVYITVPAYEDLWSIEDDVAGHFRRYNLTHINRVLASAGFTVLFSSYIFRFLPIPIFFLRTLPYRMGLRPSPNTQQDVSRDHAVREGFISKIVSAMLRHEIENIDTLRSMRYGGSCLIAARAF